MTCTADTFAVTFNDGDNLPIDPAPLRVAHPLDVADWNRCWFSQDEDRVISYIPQQIDYRAPVGAHYGCRWDMRSSALRQRAEHTTLRLSVNVALMLLVIVLAGLLTTQVGV